MRKIINKTVHFVSRLKPQQKIYAIWRKAKEHISSFVGGQFKKRQERYNLIPMRELSESEKYVVKKLVEWDFQLNERPFDWHNESLASILSDFTRQYKSMFEVDFKNKKIKIAVSAKTTTGLLTILNKYRRDFITMIYFIDYLYNEKLLYVTPLNENATPIPNSAKHLENNFDYQNTSLPIDDINLFETLTKYYDKALIPTEYLVKYYKQDFKTDEEVRFDKNISKVNESIDVAKNGVRVAEKSLNVAWTGIYVAIFIGLISIGIGLYGIFKPNNETQIILDRIDKLEEKTDKRFIDLENRMNIRFDSIEKRLNRIEYELFVVKPWKKYYQEMTSKKEKK